MQYAETLARLAEAAGIEPCYWDIFGTRHDTTELDMQALLAALGHPATDEATAAASLEKLETARWGRLLEPVTVLRTTGGQMWTTLTTRPADRDRTFTWVIEQEDGLEMRGEVIPAGLAALEVRDIAGVTHERWNLPLPSHLAYGYHTLRLLDDAGTLRDEGSVIVCPTRCWRPDFVEEGGRAWGIACQLYSVRTAIDWGLGDFSSLRSLAQATGAQGGHVVGINPLHALFPHNPAHASPYSPASRLFLNPLYIDVEAVPELADSKDARFLMADTAFMDRLKTVRGADLVDYPAVSALKHEILRVLHKAFAALPETHARKQAFADFLDAGGYRLHRFAVFNVLQEEFAGTPWPQWPEEFRNPAGPAVLDFAAAQMDRVRYHLWLQFEADRQLGAAAEALTTAAGGGPVIGLYRDLAVGVDTSGADTWMEPGVYAVGARVGCPPDAFNSHGQDWGLPPLNPLVLRDMGYGPFVEMVRANMRHAGALRMDHAMALQHLYWIPPGVSAMGGTYVSYPMDDLLGILALESHRNCCMVIGEDLGTVPDGFRDHMAAEDILSYRLFYFERYPDGLFKRPETYPEQAVATATSHDLHTIVGHWRGWDVRLRHELGLIPEGASPADDDRARVREREVLLAALQDQGVVPQDFGLDPAADEAALRTLVQAIHRFLARSPARLMMVNLDDLALEEAQVNLPGTVDQYPNWRRRLSKTLEAIAADPDFAATAAAVRAERAHVPPPVRR